MKKNEPRMFVNPFSDLFIDKWQLWKDYKKEAFNFSYKGVISEQMAIKHLVELSEGDEQKAEKIINQSIRRLWQGFFPLKETTHGTKQQQPKSGSKNGANSSSLEDDAANVLNKRNEERGQQDYGSNLKAV